MPKLLLVVGCHHNFSRNTGESTIRWRLVEGCGKLSVKAVKPLRHLEKALKNIKLNCAMRVKFSFRMRNCLPKNNGCMDFHYDSRVLCRMLGSMVMINGLFHLLTTGIYWGDISHWSNHLWSQDFQRPTHIQETETLIHHGLYIFVRKIPRPKAPKSPGFKRCYTLDGSENFPVTSWYIWSN